MVASHHAFYFKTRKLTLRHQMILKRRPESKNCEIQAFIKGEEEKSMKTIPVMFP